MVLSCFMLISSCSEKDLTLSDPNQIPPETFFVKRIQVESAVTAAYANLQTRGLYTRHMFFMMDNMAHENEGNSQLESDKRAYLDFSFNSSHGPIGDYWDTCFRGINKANLVIDNQEAINTNILEKDLSQVLKDKYIGEAKFLRGLYYFFLVTRFGGVPLVTTVADDDTGVARSTKEEVYAQIVKDLKDASADLLPKADEDLGRATQGAAIALLGKVYLFQGKYQAALDEFEKLEGYDLEPDFFDNFRIETENGIESIFEVQYTAALGSANQWDSAVSGAGIHETTFRGQEYGLLNWFNVYPSDRLLDEYEAGDERYAATFYSVGDEYNAGSSTIVQDDLKNGDVFRRAGWRKYQNYYKTDSEDTRSEINMKVIRYADVLLMMAECENEVGTQATAIGYINQVRMRAGGLSALATTLSKEQVFDAIVHERAVELAGEQCRFNDLIRWGIAMDVLSDTNFNESIHTLLPIPDREFSSNPLMSSADQNPGY